MKLRLHENWLFSWIKLIESFQWNGIYLRWQIVAERILGTLNLIILVTYLPAKINWFLFILQVQKIYAVCA